MSNRTSGSFPSPLRGVIPPMVTPLLEQDVLDVAGLERLVEHIVTGGVHGIFVLGTTGEAPSLSYRLRRELIRRSCTLVKGRVPVLVGVTDASAVEAQHLAEYAYHAGADAVVLAAPFYFPIRQDELARYVENLVPRMPLPVLLYNMPSHTKVGFAAETVSRLLELPTVVGLKDSSPGAACFHAVRETVVARRPGFSLLVGSEELMVDAMPLGAHGAVSGGANVFPRLFADLYGAAAAGDRPRSAALQQQVLNLRSTLYAVSNEGYAALRAMKGALACMGLCSDVVASPLHPLSDEERTRIAAHLRDMGLAVSPPPNQRPMAASPRAS